jgi:hypothetical protein
MERVFGALGAAAGPRVAGATNSLQSECVISPRCPFGCWVGLWSHLWTYSF